MPMDAVSPDDDIVARKADLRDSAAARRDALHADAGPDVSDALIAGLAGPCKPRAGSVVSGFWPFRSEIDLRGLLAHLHELGARVCLPVVAGKGRPLIFRNWHPGMDMVTGNFGVLTPPPEAELMRPEFLLIPMLAFDAEGYRLGYGGGFYDRTLESLRADGGEVVAIGVAYAGQQVNAVPRTETDQPLDAILTERGLLSTGN